MTRRSRAGWCCAIDERGRNDRMIVCRIKVGIGTIDDVVHPSPHRRIDIGRMTKDEGENLMTGCDFGQMNIGFEADLFEFLNTLIVHRVVEVLGHGIRVGGQPFAEHLGCAKPKPAGDVADALEECLGELALFDLLANFGPIIGLQDIVHVRQQRPQGQSHRIAPTINTKKIRRREY